MTNMSGRTFTVVACTLLAATAAPLHAQQPAAGRSLKRSTPALTAFFAGRWRCEGAFNSGKPITATMDFRETLDGAWLSAQHDDTPPGNYHALALWGVPAGGGLVANIADSQGNMRRFLAPAGWSNDRVVFARDTTYPGVGLHGERFIYARDTAGTFRMTYEVTLDNVTWQEGDHLVCARMP